MAILRGAPIPVEHFGTVWSQLCIAMATCIMGLIWSWMCSSGLVSNFTSARVIIEGVAIVTVPGALTLAGCGVDLVALLAMFGTFTFTFMLVESVAGSTLLLDALLFTSVILIYNLSRIAANYVGPPFGYHLAVIFTEGAAAVRVYILFRPTTPECVLIWLRYQAMLTLGSRIAGNCKLQGQKCGPS